MKVLVTAASKHGGTEEIADWIGATLTEAGLDAVVRPPAEVSSLDGVDAVVLGSGVYVGKWLAPAVHLAERLGRDLRARPTFLFSSGPAGDPPKPESDPVDVEKIRELTGAEDHIVFAGRIARDRMGFGERAVLTALRVPDGDFRPRAEVQAWARHIAERLTVGSATGPAAR